MSKEVCLARMTEAFAEKGVKPEQLSIILDEIDAIKKDAKTHSEYLQKAKKYYQQAQYELADNQKNRIENAIKLNAEIINLRSQDVFKENPKKYLESILVGTDMKSMGGNRSIEAEAGALSMKYQSVLVHALEDQGLMKAIKSGEYTEEIFKIFKEGDAGVSQTAKDIAKILKTVDDGLINDVQIAGSTKRKLAERVIRRTYNAEKMVKEGLEEWNTFAKEHLDIDRMRNEGALGPDENPDELLKEVYGSVISGTYERSLSSSIDIDRAPLRGNRDAKLRRSRLIHFKTAAAEVGFLDRFGDGDILPGVVSNISGTARDAATFRRLGTRPAEAWNSIKSELGKVATEGKVDAETGKILPPSDKQLKNFDKLRTSQKSLDNLFDFVTSGPQGGSSRIARYGKNLRALAGMSKLGGSTVKAFTSDLGSTIANLKHSTGKSWLGATTDSIGSTMKNLSPGERKKFSEMGQLYFGTALGDIHGRMQQGDYLNGGMAKAQDIFYKVNGMTYATDAVKTANQVIHSKELGGAAGKTLDSIDPDYKVQLERYGMNDHDLAQLSKGTEQVDGNTMVSQSELDTAKLTPPEGMTEAEYRFDLKLKVGAYLLDNTNIGSPTPGAKARSMFINGVNLDSGAGQFLQFASQFKTFPIKMVEVVNRQVLGGSKTTATSFSEVFSNPLKHKEATMRLASTMTMLTAFGMMGVQFSELVKGRTIKPLDDPKTYIDAMIVGGSAGLYGDFLFGEYNKRYKNLAGDLMGPVLGGTFSSAAEVWAGMIRGEPKASQAFNLLLQNAPFGNLIFARAGMDYLFLDDIRETLSPGYKSRRRSTLKQSGQEIWLGE